MGCEQRGFKGTKTLMYWLRTEVLKALRQWCMGCEQREFKGTKTVMYWLRTEVLKAL